MPGLLAAQQQSAPQGQPPEQQSMEATPEQNDLMQRIVVNAMRIISGDETGNIVDGLLFGSPSAGEGLSNALTYTMQAVVGGLQKKGVIIPPELIMAENGVASQVTQLLVSLIGANGGDITPNEIKKGIQIGLNNFGVKQMQQAEGAQEELSQGGIPPEQQQAMLQNPSGPPPQSAPQGILAGAQR